MDDINLDESRPCWWLGINNTRKPRSGMHVCYPQIESFLHGNTPTFKWTFGGSPGSTGYYSRMRTGDGVVFWMGDGEHEQWGIVAFGVVSQLVPLKQCTLRLLPGTTPIIPYPKKRPAETSETEFLRAVFGIHFRPLRKLFVRLGFADIKPCVATIDEMTWQQFVALLGRAQTSDQEESNGRSGDRPPEEQRLPPRLEVTTCRIVRNTQLSRLIKELYHHRCQICGTVIELHDGDLYSEAHHIKPLGIPHSGPDTMENLLVVCPNHHVMCDYGVIMLDVRKLELHPEHSICASYIDYHNAIIYRPLESSRSMP